jgi:hypothetical protein
MELAVRNSYEKAIEMNINSNEMKKLMNMTTFKRREMMILRSLSRKKILNITVI